MKFSVILYAKSEIITVSYIVNTPSIYLFHCLSAYSRRVFRKRIIIEPYCMVSLLNFITNKTVILLQFLRSFILFSSCDGRTGV